jgi:hypothetical protein
MAGETALVLLWLLGAILALATWIIPGAWRDWREWRAYEPFVPGCFVVTSAAMLVICVVCFVGIARWALGG